ncbi:hypothetical protein ACIPRI_19790 [Variovorax sp. LARHSF232]
MQSETCEITILHNADGVAPPVDAKLCRPSELKEGGEAIIDAEGRHVRHDA